MDQVGWTLSRMPSPVLRACTDIMSNSIRSVHDCSRDCRKKLPPCFNESTRTPLSQIPSPLYDACSHFFCLSASFRQFFWHITKFVCIHMQDFMGLVTKPRIRAWIVCCKASCATCRLWKPGLCRDVRMRVRIHVCADIYSLFACKCKLLCVLS